MLAASTAAVAACGSGPAPSGGRSMSAVTGSMAHLRLPLNEAATPFSPLQAQFYAFEAIASSGNSAAMPSLSSPVTLTTGSSQCSETGCPFLGGPVALREATLGAFVQLSGVQATSQRFVPTATMVVSPNQIDQAKRLGGAVQAQGLAYLVSTAGLGQLAKLTQVSPSELLERGVAIGLVASVRHFGPVAPPGLPQAMVTLKNNEAGASVFYPNDAWDNLSARGTNAQGAFIVVGGPTPAEGDGATTTTIAIAAVGSSLRYVDQRMVTRPGAILILPILPFP